MVSGIRPLDPRNAGDVQAAVRLHCALLPQSPVSRLGPEFMRLFYYRKLVEDGLVQCDLAYHDGRAAGVIAYTRYPFDFMANGLRRHWLYLVAVTAYSLLRHPGRLGIILPVVAMLRERKRQAGDVPEGEILSFGVLPEYRGADFVRRSGRRIPVELFERARAFFLKEGISSFRMLVEADNREALLFYHTLGCKLEKTPEGAGNTVQATYTIKELPGCQVPGLDTGLSNPGRSAAFKSAS